MRVPPKVFPLATVVQHRFPPPSKINYRQMNVHQPNNYEEHYLGSNKEYEKKKSEVQQIDSSAYANSEEHIGECWRCTSNVAGMAETGRQRLKRGYYTVIKPE